MVWYTEKSEPSPNVFGATVSNMSTHKKHRLSAPRKASLLQANRKVPRQVVQVQLLIVIDQSSHDAIKRRRKRFRLRLGKSIEHVWVRALPPTVVLVGIGTGIAALFISSRLNSLSHTHLWQIAYLPQSLSLPQAITDKPWLFRYPSTGKTTIPPS